MAHKVGDLIFFRDIITNEIHVTSQRYQFTWIIPESDWITIMSELCYRGQSEETYAEAKIFHTTPSKVVEPSPNV